ncbi:hypothetical protein BpHYR1_039521 [Brachionus plicatilis]|uniref:Uncharacterized protein n=1 Tax=Brachionus plicatilis TaxID=10195 RepID=A0A3M7R3K8_BRAPC|nr:hypothetical protein BpHYR1_039521 [Brachionus plicatilis]
MTRRLIYFLIFDFMSVAEPWFSDSELMFKILIKRKLNTMINRLSSIETRTLIINTDEKKL